jgi:hypothetical protein
VNSPWERLIVTFDSLTELRTRGAILLGYNTLCTSKPSGATGIEKLECVAPSSTRTPVFDGSMIELFEVRFVEVIREPLMIERLICRHPLAFVENEEPSHKVLWSWSDSLPISRVLYRGHVALSGQDG